MKSLLPEIIRIICLLIVLSRSIVCTVSGVTMLQVLDQKYTLDVNEAARHERLDPVLLKKVLL